MNRDPKVVIVETDGTSLDNIGITKSLFDDDVEELHDEDLEKEDKPPGRFKLFFINNKAWLITIAVLLLTIVALGLTVYFINVKCNTTVRAEHDRATKMITDLEEQSETFASARDKYCEEAQRLRSQLHELSEEFDRLKSAPPPKAVNKLQQKKILEEYSREDQPKKKHKKVTFANSDEAIAVDLPHPSTQKHHRIVEESVTMDQLNAGDMDAVVTAPEEDFDEDVIDM